MSDSRLMQCPWCGRTMWQETEDSGNVNGKCRYCKYRYEAKCDSASGQIITEITPGVPEEMLPDVEIGTLGAPEEISKAYRDWLDEEEREVMRQIKKEEEEEIMREIKEEEEEYWRTHPYYD